MAGDVGRIEWYRSDDDPATFLYMADAPGPEKDPTGRPVVSLLVSDKGAIVLLGAHWGPEAEALEQLRKSLAKQFSLDPLEVRLSPAPAAVDKVILAVGDGQGGFSDVARTTASGFAPYTVTFNVALSAKHKAWAATAFAGSPDRLIVTYQGALPVTVSVDVTIEGDVKDALAALGQKPTLVECAAQIEKAIRAKRLQITHAASAEAPDTLKQQAERLAKDKAARVLQGMASAHVPAPPPAAVATSMFKVTASLSGSVSRPFARSTDVSTWFAKGDGSAYVRVSPAPLPEPVEPTPGPTPAPAPTPLPLPVADKDAVRLGFDPKDAPIALVQASRGQASVTLRAPEFTPGTLTGPRAPGVDKPPLTVTTRYTVFGRPYDATVAVPVADGWVLTPANLGLAQVTLDGSARREAKAKEVRVHVRYAPAGRGTEDDRTITLTGNEWSATWHVVTRDADLDGILEYDWQETSAAGSVTSFPPATTDKPEIKL